MQYVVVDLARAIVVGEVDEPVAPSLRVGDGERADEARYALERLEHHPLGRAQPCSVSDQAIDSPELRGIDTQRPHLRRHELCVRPAEICQQALDREGVEDLGRRRRGHNVYQGSSLDLGMAALVEVEQDVAVAPLGDHPLDHGIGALERAAEVADAQVKLRTCFLYGRQHRRGEGLQDFRDVGERVVEDQQAFHFDRSVQALAGAPRFTASTARFSSSMKMIGDPALPQV